MPIDWRRSVLAALSLILVLPLWAGPGVEAAVDFQLQRLDGGEARLSEFRGQWVVLNYWATWCAPCRKEIPELSALHRQRSDITVLGLAFEDPADTDLAGFLAEFDVAYPILLVDVYQPPAPFGAPKVMPTTIILDAAGIAVKSFLGPVTGEMITDFIDSAAAP